MAPGLRGPWSAGFPKIMSYLSLNKAGPKTKVYDEILISILSYDEVPALPLILKAKNSSLLTGRSNCLS